MFRTLVTLALFFLLTATATADDWTQYRGLQGDGISSESIQRPNWAAGTGPKILWKVNTPLGFSSFTVVGDRAYTMISLDGRETCLALDANTGKQLWTFKLGES